MPVCWACHTEATKNSIFNTIYIYIYTYKSLNLLIYIFNNTLQCRHIFLLYKTSESKWLPVPHSTHEYRKCLRMLATLFPRWKSKCESRKWLMSNAVKEKKQTRTFTYSYHLQQSFSFSRSSFIRHDQSCPHGVIFYGKGFHQLLDFRLHICCNSS